MNDTRFVKRMEDKFDIPEMNGTIKDLLLIISGPLSTHKQNADAIRNISKVLLHTYMLEKKILEQLIAMEEKTKSKEYAWKSILFDKVLPQLVTFAVLGILTLLFKGDLP